MSKSIIAGAAAAVIAAAVAGGMLIGRLFLVARDLARKLGIDENGYRLIINCNAHGGQEVYHLHLHLIEDARRLADAARQRFDGLGLRKESALASLLLGRAARLAGAWGRADIRAGGASTSGGGFWRGLPRMASA